MQYYKFAATTVVSHRVLLMTVRRKTTMTHKVSKSVTIFHEHPQIYVSLVITHMTQTHIIEYDSSTNAIIILCKTENVEVN